MLLDFDTIVRKYGKPEGILHVGANTGQEADAYHKHVNKVVWIEALPDVFGQLLSNVSRYGDICINACVHEEDNKEVIFFESNNEAQSSSLLELGTHKAAHPEVHYVKEHKMFTKRLDTILDTVEIFDIGLGLDFLAMDIQGAELLALKGLGSRLNQFKYVYLEVNTQEVYKGCALLPEVDKYLRSFGFQKKEERIFKQWGWGDCLYLR